MVMGSIIMGIILVDEEQLVFNLSPCDKTKQRMRDKWYFVLKLEL